MQIKNNKTKQLTLVIGTAMFSTVLFSQAASATTLIADFGVGENLYLKVDGVETRDWAGSIKIDVDGVNTLALCVNLFTSMSVNHTYGTTIGNEATIDNGGRVAWLMENEMSTLSGASQFAGLQLAVWDIVHDNGNGFSTGRIQQSTAHATDVAAVNEATALLALSLGHSASDGTVYNNYNQCDFSKVQTLEGVPAGSHGYSSTPEPQTMGMMVLGGLTGLWMKFRRRG